MGCAPAAAPARSSARPVRGAAPPTVARGSATTAVRSGTTATSSPSTVPGAVPHERNGPVQPVPAPTATDPGAPTGTAPGAVAPTTTAPAAAPPEAAPAADPTCPASALDVALDLQPATGAQPADRVRALLVLTDVAAPVCELDGFAGIGTVLAGRVRPVAGRDVDRPAAGVVVVERDGSAFAGAEWTTGPACPTVGRVEVTPPGQTGTDTAGVNVPDGSGVPLRVCAGSWLLGPVASTSVGATASAVAGGG